MRASARGAVDAPASCLRPVWSDPHTRGLMTSRAGGYSAAPYDSFNLRSGIGDDEAAVAANQRLLAAWCGATPVWLEQVHGPRVVVLEPADARPGAPPHRADAAVSTTPGLACAVQVADCLPVLMAARGRAVGAAHAGWRGLAAGVVEATLATVCEQASCAPAEVEVWLGACIGPRRFEVGADVLAAFGVAPAGQGAPVAARFRPRGADHPGKWWADLPGLAADRLRAAGVERLSGAGLCTVEERSRFFSFRRDGLTGRMAALVWLEAVR